MEIGDLKKKRREFPHDNFARKPTISMVGGIAPFLFFFNLIIFFFLIIDYFSKLPNIYI